MRNKKNYILLMKASVFLFVCKSSCNKSTNVREIQISNQTKNNKDYLNIYFVSMS